MTYRTEFGDYDAEYGSIDYDGATVLDIGADYGTTARYFLERGARRVVVSERDPVWRERLEALAAEDPRVAVVEPLTAGTAAGLLDFYRPDIVKTDCEKCEQIWLGVNDDLLSLPRAWVFETHTQHLYDALTERFAAMGYQVRTIIDHPVDPARHPRAIKVFTAVWP